MKLKFIYLQVEISEEIVQSAVSFFVPFFLFPITTVRPTMDSRSAHIHSHLALQDSSQILAGGFDLVRLLSPSSSREENDHRHITSVGEMQPRHFSRNGVAWSGAGGVASSNALLLLLQQMDTMNLIEGRCIYGKVQCPLLLSYSETALSVGYCVTAGRAGGRNKTKKKL